MPPRSSLVAVTVSSLFVATVLAASPALPPPSSPVSAVATKPAVLDRTAAARSLAKALDAARSAGFSGAVLVAERGDIVFEGAVGMADRASSRANTLDTPFNLASTGKLFTTVAVLQLVEQGKLDLDAPVGRYLPEWPQADIRDRATLRHLLTHTSGLGSYFETAGYRNRHDRLRSVADHLDLVAGQHPGFAPGTGWAYSNSGYILLGRLIEVASGEDYYDYIRRNVFEPAGMGSSGYYDGNGRAPGVATGYILAADGARANDSERELRGGPAGGGFASARDLLRFQQALGDGRLLRPATVDTWLTPIALPSEGALRHAGLGALVMPAGDDIAYAHPGGGPGMASEFWATRRGDVVVILLGNIAPVPHSGQPRLASDLTQAILQALADAGGPRFSLGNRRG